LAAKPKLILLDEPVAGMNATEIQFTDESTGNPVQWYWKFGDGSTSTERNPKHTYASKKTYTVVLYVKGVDCKGTLSSWTSNTKAVTVT
jgi:PKD repeat protein